MYCLLTCRQMAPREKGGVVDRTLSECGFVGLKQAESSTPPRNVGANTNNAAWIVGVKAADLFIKELGIKARM